MKNLILLSITLLIASPAFAETMAQSEPFFSDPSARVSEDTSSAVLPVSTNTDSMSKPLNFKWCLLNRNWNETVLQLAYDGKLTAAMILPRNLDLNTGFKSERKEGNLKVSETFDGSVYRMTESADGNPMTTIVEVTSKPFFKNVRSIVIKRTFGNKKVSEIVCDRSRPIS